VGTGPGVLIEVMFRSIGGYESTVFEGARWLHCEPASAVAVSTSWALGIWTAFAKGGIMNVYYAKLHPESYIFKPLLFLQYVFREPNVCMCKPKPL